METRGLRFFSKSGASYYYDDWSGMCYLCPKGLADTLGALTPEDIARLLADGPRSHWERLVLARHSAYGAFFGEANPRRPIRPEDADHILAETGFKQLVLSVTESCNLRCRYCILSDAYAYPAAKRLARMSIETAQAAVGEYLAQVRRCRQRDPAKQAVVGFYGGEPLLNFPVIRHVVCQVETQIPNASFHISTNGLLLEGEIARFLIDHRFMISISLDGPLVEHDRNRVLPSGEGSFDVVFRNVQALRETYPDYDRLAFLVTYDWRTDLVELQRFFRDWRGFHKSIFLFNPVSGGFTSYYQKFEGAERDAFKRRVAELRQLLATPAALDDPVVWGLAAASVFLFVNRRLILPSARRGIGATGACFPGDKICVRPDGTFQVCEKIPRLPSIGSATEGIDYQRIVSILEEYHSAIVCRCHACPISRLCGACFAHFWSGTHFCLPTPSYCQDQVNRRLEMLQEDFSLLEEVPELYARLRGATVNCFVNHPGLM
jgi:uncharacterized protein